MLYAKNKNGQLIRLSYLSELEKEAIHKQVFYCPACHRRMQLRRGRTKTWYFAHACTSNEEGQGMKKRGVGESDLHKDGKEALYRWVERDATFVQKEFIRRVVKQRPDLYCIYKEKSFALEYQCATLDINDLRKRTELHIQCCDDPIWIMGEDGTKSPMKKKMFFKSPMYFQDLFTVLPVSYLFEPPFSNLTIYLPISSFSPRKILYATISLPQHISFFQAIQVIPLNFPIETMKQEWLHEKKKYRLSQQLKSSQLLKYLFYFFPQNQLNFPLIPTTVGVPVLYAYHLYSHCVEWQLWFQLCILAPMDKNSRVSLSEIQREWCHMIQRRYIIVQPLPLVYKTNHFDALKAYMCFLEGLAMITISGSHIQKGRPEQRLNHIEDVLLADKNILNYAFTHLKSQLKLMVEKNKKG